MRYDLGQDFESNIDARIAVAKQAVDYLRRTRSSHRTGRAVIPLAPTDTAAYLFERLQDWGHDAIVATEVEGKLVILAVTKVEE